MGIVDHIKAICMQHGTTIPRLERVLGFGNGTIYNWARSSPSIDKVQKVADHFSVSVDRILYGFERSQFDIGQADHDPKNLRTIRPRHRDRSR